MHTIRRFSISWSKWWLLLPIVIGVLIFGFAIFYLSHSYQSLADNYKSTHFCFYRYAEWQAEFFTPKTKADGNRYCLIAIVCCVGLSVYSFYRLRRQKTRVKLTITYAKGDVFALAGLLLFGLGLWIWGFVCAPPAYDEVFSAINCAGAGPELSLSYYMLPNNHVLFNVLNSSLFGWVHDNIISGRLISGLAHAAFIVLIYKWLQEKLANRLYAVLCCAVIMLQFPVWGFSFQARGYSIYLLCAAASLIMLEQYLERRKKLSLAAHMLACIIGFAVMPSFLFWYAPVVVIIGYSFICKRRVDCRLLVAQALVLICVFLFYLPVLCYSGLPALTENQYVRVAHQGFPDFWANFTSGFDATIRYCFASDVDGHSWLYPILFALPLAVLPIVRKSAAARNIIVGLTIWIVFFLLQLKFRHYPFMRNMVAHCVISLLALLLALFFSLKKLASTFRIRLLLPVGMGIFSLACSIHFVWYMADNMNNGLYFYDVNGRYSDQVNMLKAIPANAKVWTSDESFFPRYILTQKGMDASRCYNDSQLYFVLDRTINEQLPVSVRDVQVIDSVNQYLLYRHK